MKLCKDCRFFKQIFSHKLCAKSVITEKCFKLGKNAKSYKCEIARSKESYCGQKAKWFEEKEI